MGSQNELIENIHIIEYQSLGTLKYTLLLENEYLTQLANKNYSVV
jgi:hypothetical protein